MARTAVLQNLTPGARARRRDDVVTVAAAAGDTESTLAAVDERLRHYVPFDAACWFSTDPGTLFATWPVRIHHIESGHCTSYWDREFIVEDTNLFADVSRRPRPAASLHGATAGLLERSARYREFMRPQGFADELRAALRSGASTWGLVGLLRYEGSEAFSVEEIAFLSELSEPLAAILRLKVLQETVSKGSAELGPGLLMFDAAGRLSSLNDAAVAWRAQLPHRVIDEDDMPVAVYTVLAHARAVAQGHQRGSARVRALSSSGQWLVLHASCMTDVDGNLGQTAVVIEPATRNDIIPIIVEAYQLSAREQQVVAAITRGASTADIAAELHLSPHTVRDHLKAIFAKVGVTSRGELVAMLYFQHYEPDLNERYVHA